MTNPMDSTSNFNLSDHYKHCIRLNATNKINAKNAFVLQLIDYMHDLVNPSDDGQMNFKIASSALDVGAKIYSHRVDCVHSEAQKVASSILMALDSDQQKPAQDDDSGSNNNDSLNDSNEGEDAPNRAKKKRVAARKNIKTIVDNPYTLNGKIEKLVIADAYLDGLSQDYDMSCPAALICYNPRTQPDGLLSIDSNHRNLDYCKPGLPLSSSSTHTCTQDPANFVPLITKYADCVKIIRENKQNRICSRLDGFLFKDRSTVIKGFDSSNDVEEIRASPTLNRTNNEIDLENGQHRFQADLYNDNDCDDDFPMGDFGNDADQTQIIDPEAENVVEDIMNNLKKIGASKPTEYGYTNELRVKDTWAGPHAWKSVRQQTTKKDGPPKSARKRQKMEQKPIKFQDDPSESKEQTADKDTRHSSDVIKKWKKPLLPQDHNLNSESGRHMLTHAFERPELLYLCLESIKEDHNYVKNDDMQDDTVPQSPPMAFDEYHDESDDEFRADPMVGDNEVAIFGAVQNMTLTQDADFEFGGDNLIDMPVPIPTIQISYAKVAKKMDVRRLKRAMWDLLSPPESRFNSTIKDTTIVNNQTVVEMDDSNNDGQQLELTLVQEPSVKLRFSDLYVELPGKVHPKMAHDLSEPIAFVTLLHLANEKNLKLSSTDDLTDFVIESDDRGNC